MKTLFALFALMISLTIARADVAEVKRVLDEPMVLNYVGRREGGGSISRQDYEDMAALSKKPVSEIQQTRGLKISLREYFSIAGNSQGVTARQLALIRHITATNALSIREKLMTVMKEAKMTASVSDLEEALKSAELSKTLDRAAQDRFARLAKIAP